MIGQADRLIDYFLWVNYVITFQFIHLFYLMIFINDFNRLILNQLVNHCYLSKWTVKMIDYVLMGQICNQMPFDSMIHFILF